MLSAVVCTLNRYDQLPDCLESLVPKKQTAAAGAYEVVVVDNTPPDNRRSFKDVTLSDRGIFRWVVCEEVGLSAARNAGLEASKGDIVAFIDDDAIASKMWCAETIAAFERHPEALAVGGRVVPEYPGKMAPSWLTPKLSELLSCIDWGDEERALRPGEWIVGANMSFRRSVFSEEALFNTSLGRKGNIGLLSNEEIEIMRRIGHERIVYNPKMLVQHVIAPERLNQPWFRRRIFWQALSDQLAGIDIPPNSAAWREMRRLIPRLAAERRGVTGLFGDCDDSREFALQLREIYLLTHLMAGGTADA